MQQLCAVTAVYVVVWRYHPGVVKFYEGVVKFYDPWLKKMITSCLVVFGAPSRLVKVRGACDEPFWIYKRRPHAGQ